MFDDEFETAIEYVLGNEGGYVDNPQDPGGATNFGITQRLYDKYTGGGQSVQNITLDIAKKVYDTVFWLPLQLSQLPLGHAIAIFDIAVNQGPEASVRYAQYAAGFAVADGVMGPKTIAAISKIESIEFLAKFAQFVLDGYIGLVIAEPSKLVFLKGWGNRTIRLISLTQP